MRTCGIVSSVVLCAVAWCGVAFAELPLDLIAVFHSDSAGGRLARGCMSPGDIDGDGFSEIFVAEYAGEKRLHVFSGGSPPDTIPDMLIGNYGATHAWVSDINADGIRDFVMRSSYSPEVDTLQIWFGGLDFLQKSGPDLLLIQPVDTFDCFGCLNMVSSGDVNGDGQNDLVVAAINGEIAPYDGRFYVYYGGDILDTFVDEAISFYDQGNGYNDFYLGTGVGDINGDGLMDYVWTGTNDNYPGYVAVMYGRIPLDSVPDHVIWSPYTGSQADDFGRRLYALGDVNKDGYADFAVTGGNIWPCLFFGGEPFDTIPLILGDTTDTDTFGETVANVGDINNDGWDDIAVGLPSLDLGDGAVYVYLGYREMDGGIDLTLHHDDVWPVVGYLFGQNLGPAGDFNGDGVDDLVVTSMGSIHYPSAKGNVYVFAGDPDLPTDADEIWEEENLPTEYNILQQNYPNPFNSSTAIEYELPGISEREVELSIYNILGQKIRTLKKCRKYGGMHVAYWDGTDQAGRAVPSGVYFYSLNSGKLRVCKKLLLLK